MRMKFKKTGQLLLAAAASLGVAGLITACSQLTATLTVDFVYVASAKAAGPDNYGEVDVFEINSESGHMRQIPTSPFPSGGRNPVAEATSIDNTNLYVVNQDDNNIVQFIIGSDGKLYPQNTVNTPGVFPLATSVAKSNLAVTLPTGAAATASSSLYVADTYQPLPTCSPASPCSGSVAVFPVLPAFGTTSVGSLQRGTPINDCNGLTYLPLSVPSTTPSSGVIAPTAVSATADGSFLIASAYNSTTGTGYVFGYAVGSIQCPSGSAFPAVPTLTPLAGSPVAVGVHPSAIATNPSGSFAYVTDFAANNVTVFNLSASGIAVGTSYPTGNEPSSITVDATGKFAFVANSQDSNVTTYSIGGGGSALASVGTFTTGVQPVAVGIDPRMNKYIFTANFLGNNVSGFALDANTGNLLNTQYSPFAANANPTAVAAIPHNGSTH